MQAGITISYVAHRQWRLFRVAELLCARGRASRRSIRRAPGAVASYSKIVQKDHADSADGVLTLQLVP